MNTPPMVSSNCPACGHYWAVPFFDGGSQPLTTLGWPRSAEAAQTMPRHRLDFVRCPDCGHVWNRAFCYEDIPYTDHPNLMFNAGAIWQRHLAGLASRAMAELPNDSTIIEIGCGNGHFLRAMAERHPGKYLGFDPHGSAMSAGRCCFEQRFFFPFEDIPRFNPNLIVMRHVLEHFAEPAQFVEQLAWAATNVDHRIWLLVEVPCIDRVFATGRTADFFYEHPQQFSTSSFETLLKRAGLIASIHHAYDGEVVVGLVELNVPSERRARADEAALYHRQVPAAQRQIGQQLHELSKSGHRVAIWGGTGKAAAFIHQYGLDAARFPFVVDSDPNKVGTYVPGTGQKIHFRDALKKHPAEVIIVPTQWRARDIVAEMRREGIVAKQVLIEHEGRLVDFLTDDHPYLGTP